MQNTYEYGTTDIQSPKGQVFNKRCFFFQFRYTADENGYRETREEQANFVQIRARPVVATVPAAPAVTQVVQQIKPVVQQTVASTAGKSDSDLVAKIIAQLTPFIK